MNKVFSILLISAILFSQAGFVLAIDCTNACGSPAGDCDEYCDNRCRDVSGSCTGLNPPTTGEVCFCNPLGTNDISELIANITNYIFYVAIILAPLMILIGAFMYLTSAGDPNKVKRATDLIRWTAIGLAIILFSKGIISLIKYILGA